MGKCFICGGLMKNREMMVLELFEDHSSARGKQIYIHEHCYDFALNNPKGKIDMCDDCHRIVVHIKKYKNLKLCKHCIDQRDSGKPKGEPPVDPPF